MRSVYHGAFFCYQLTIKQFCNFFTKKGDTFYLSGVRIISLDMLDFIVKTRLVLKSLGKMLFKNSPRKLLACILAVAPLPIMKGLVRDLAQTFIRKGFPKKMLNVNRKKIDGVGPVDNRPSTD